MAIGLAVIGCIATCQDSLAQPTEGPTLYPADDPKVQEVRQGVQDPSAESQRIQRCFVGDWIYQHEVAHANVSYRWTTLRIFSEGRIALEYWINESNGLRTIGGSFEFIHKGTYEHNPGRRPAVLVTLDPPDSDLVLPLVELTVAYDDRVHPDLGMTLKFSDLEGNPYVFLHPDYFEHQYQPETWLGSTKARYERAVTNWVPDFASLGVTNFLVQDEGLWANSRKLSSYVFQTAEVPGADVSLRIWECQDVASAQRELLDYFARCAAAQPFPLGPPLGVDLGDRCYLGWGVVGGLINFVRNNVFISISAPDGSVMPVAEKLDSELVRRSFTGPVLLEAGVTQGVFHVSVPTSLGKTYFLEASTSLAATNWVAFTPFKGDGTIRPVAFLTGSPQQFFRLRVE